jgi:hypothetical protein
VSTYLIDLARRGLGLRPALSGARGGAVDTLPVAAAPRRFSTTAGPLPDQVVDSAPGDVLTVDPSPPVTGLVAAAPPSEQGPVDAGPDEAGGAPSSRTSSAPAITPTTTPASGPPPADVAISPAAPVAARTATPTPAPAAPLAPAPSTPSSVDGAPGGDARGDGAPGGGVHGAAALAGSGPVEPTPDMAGPVDLESRVLAGPVPAPDVVAQAPVARDGALPYDGAVAVSEVSPAQPEPPAAVIAPLVVPPLTASALVSREGVSPDDAAVAAAEVSPAPPAAALGPLEVPRTPPFTAIGSPAATGVSGESASPCDAAVEASEVSPARRPEPPTAAIAPLVVPPLPPLTASASPPRPGAPTNSLVPAQALPAGEANAITAQPRPSGPAPVPEVASRAALPRDVHVRIGTIEVRTETQPGPAPGAPARLLPSIRGFDDYRAVRSHAGWEI